MLRTDRNIIEAYMRGTSGKSTLAHMFRGKFSMDSADLVTNKADGELVGTFLSLPIYRKAALANGIFDYYNDAGNALLTNA